ncbi:hypothetical protein DFH06DRAFT_1122712 [Mycena polygramma]|nr:hypothetical protein DFH06DRAFT_1122712 [Mycena polygramma]
MLDPHLLSEALPATECGVGRPVYQDPPETPTQIPWDASTSQDPTLRSQIALQTSSFSELAGWNGPLARVSSEEYPPSTYATSPILPASLYDDATTFPPEDSLHAAAGHHVPDVPSLAHGVIYDFTGLREDALQHNGQGISPTAVLSPPSQPSASSHRSSQDPTQGSKDSSAPAASSSPRPEFNFHAGVEHITIQAERDEESYEDSRTARPRFQAEEQLSE